MLPRLLPNRPDGANLVIKAGALFLALAFFLLFEPGDWLICPIRRFTGLPCPLCGMTHALCAIGHGQFRRAVELHALSPVVFGLFVGGLAATLAELGGWVPPWTTSLQPRIFGVLVVLLLGYWAWRLAVLMAC